MKRIFAVASIAVCLVPAVLAADPSESGRILLDRLRAQRQIVMRDPSRAPTSKPRTDLTPILGMNRNQLVQSLGAPDYCAPPSDAGCGRSPHLAYFFFPHETAPATQLAGGITEITVSAGGGWALELSLTRDSVVKASWVKQE